MGDKVKAPKAQKPKESVEVKVKEKRSTGSKVSLIIGIVLCVILVPILVLNSVLIIKGVASEDRKPPDLFGYVPLTVASPSMYPLFDEGDMILLKEVDPDDIEVGDVICFFDPAQKGNKLLTHRVVQIYEEDGQRYAKTAGDFNIEQEYEKRKDKKDTEFLDTVTKKSDPNKDGYEYWYTTDENLYDSRPVLLNDTTVVGVYSYVALPFVGHISNFMAEPYGWAICIGVPLIAFVLYEVISRKRKDKSTNKEQETLKQEKDALLAELEALRAEKEAASKAANVVDESEGASEATQAADNTEEAENSGGNSEENT